MNENSWKINGLLYCGRDGLVSNPLDFHGNPTGIGISEMHAKSMEINENEIKINENQGEFMEN